MHRLILAHKKGQLGGGRSGRGSKGGQGDVPFAHTHAVARRPSPQALGDDSERRAFEAKLREQAGARFAGVRQARLAEAERHISDLLSAAGRKLNGVGAGGGEGRGKLNGVGG